MADVEIRLHLAEPGRAGGASKDSGGGSSRPLRPHNPARHRCLRHSSEDVSGSNFGASGGVRGPLLEGRRHGGEVVPA